MLLSVRRGNFSQGRLGESSVCDASLIGVKGRGRQSRPEGARLSYSLRKLRNKT